MIKNKIYGLIGLARRAGKINFGTQSSIEAIEKRKAKLIIVTEDSAERTKKNFKILSENKNVPIRVYGNIEKMSESIGQTNKAVITINDENFSNEIIKLIDGGDVIG